MADSVKIPTGLRFIQFDYATDCRMPLHTHDDVASLNLCLKGSVQETRDHKTVPLGAASLSLMPLGVAHANHFSAGASTFLVVLEKPWIERLREVTTLLDTPAVWESGRATWIATRMYQEFRRRDAVTGLVLEGMLLELFAGLARDSATFRESGLPSWLRQATDFVHAHFLQNLSIPTLAEAVGVHPSHLMRGFQRHHACTVGEYVRRLRIEYTCHLLSNSDTSLGQIAREAGFADQSHFNRTFKSQRGVTPTEYRGACQEASLRQQKRF